MSAQLTSGNYAPTNVIPLRSTRIATEPDGAEFQLVGRGPAERFTELVTAIEALSCQLIAERSLRSPQSPFDAIYISALRPDDLPVGALRNLRRFTHIEDRSDELTFDDGLE